MSLSSDIIIKTDRCKLRITNSKDIPFIFSATKYEEFNDGMLWDVPEDDDEFVEPYKERMTAWNDGQMYGFTICRQEDEQPLGRIRLGKESDKVWSIGYWMHPLEQGKGYMSESVKAILKFVFQKLGAEQIVAFHALGNNKSERVLKKVGMKFVEYIPRGFMKKGEWVEENKLGITKEEWEKVN